jgi:hypothetical protein
MPAKRASRQVEHGRVRTLLGPRIRLSLTDLRLCQQTRHCWSATNFVPFQSIAKFENSRGTAICRMHRHAASGCKQDHDCG